MSMSLTLTCLPIRDVAFDCITPQSQPLLLPSPVDPLSLVGNLEGPGNGGFQQEVNVFSVLL